MHFLSPVTISPELLHIPESILRQPCAPVDFRQWPAERLRPLVQEMFRLQYGLFGVGLAAPQVGLSLQLTVIHDRKNPPLVLINPTITRFSDQTETGAEGCLSIPGYVGQVERAQAITVAAYDVFGRPFELSAEGYLARVVQHEVDHLNGVLFPDRLNSLADLTPNDPDTMAGKAIAGLYTE